MGKNNFIIRLYRLSRMFIWFLKVIIQINFFYLNKTKAQQNQMLMDISRQLLYILNIRLEVQGLVNIDLNRTLVVANHISWVDVFVLLANYPMTFIAKQEVLKWPLIGRAASNIQTIFINRNNRKDTRIINQKIAESLAHQGTVMFFPEARVSKDGLHILPFKSALFQSAIDANAHIQGMALRYYDGCHQRTIIPAYLEGVSLLKCVWNILGLKSMIARVDILPLWDIQSLLSHQAKKNQPNDSIVHIIKEKMEIDIKNIVESDLDEKD